MIKRRNLDNSLVQWIMTVTGLGPGIGEMFWVAPAVSATSQFKSHLTTQLGISDYIYSTPLLAEDAMVAYRNDIVLVMPGNYVQTESLTWDKASSHMLGLAGPNIGGDYGDASGVNIYTVTAAVAEVLNVTGKNSQFINMGFDNNGAATTNVAGVLLNALGCVFKNSTIMGNMNGTQSANANCCSLKIHSGAFYPLFDTCHIGSDQWSARSGANSGQILFAGGSQPSGGRVWNCEIVSQSVTATVAMVAITAHSAIGRSWEFKDTGFYNFSSSGGEDGTKLNQAIYIAAAVGDAGIRIFLKDCFACGIDEWQDADDTKVMSNMSVATVGGGLGIQPTATVS